MNFNVDYAHEAMLNSNAEPSRDNEPGDSSGSSYRCEVQGTRHVVLVVVAVCRVGDQVVVAAPGGTGDVDDGAFLFFSFCFGNGQHYLLFTQQ